MNAFQQKYPSDVIGVLSGFDRLVVRGHIRQLAYLDGMKTYMALNGVRTVDFKDHVIDVSNRLRAAIEAPVRAAGRPVQYLASTKIDKEALVQGLVARDDLRQGTICLLSCVEPCRTFKARGNRERKTFDLEPTDGKCSFFYKYAFHPVVGYIHARIQTWFPFSVQIYLNGREWLTRQLHAAKIDFRRADNTLLWVKNPKRAQDFLDAQLRTNWPQLFDEILADLNPLHGTDWLGKFRAPYYWSTYQMEWATDVMFNSPKRLAQLYPRLALHSIRTLSCTNVLRFLERTTRCSSDARGALVQRAEGLRIKHSADGNSIKAYDKAYAPADAGGSWSILRLECTTTNPKGYKVFRTTANDPSQRRLPARKGVADLHGVAQAAQRVNDRYAEALVAADSSESVSSLANDLTSSASYKGRRVRGLRPWQKEDLALLRAVNDGRHLLNGLRNKDLRAQLYLKPAASPLEERRRSAKTSRLLRMLRAHGVLRKLSGTHRYQVTDFGRKALTAIITAIDATTAELARLAA